MPLTPIDIQQKTFGPELRGYNMDEVDDFLDEVVATLKDYDQRIRDAQDRIRALEAELASRGEDETAISRALVAAQKQADAIIADAEAQAEAIRQDAHGEADRLRAERDAEHMKLTQEIARMRATVADLKRRIVDLAAAAENNLDTMDAAIAEAANQIDGSEEAVVADVDDQPQEVEEIGDWGATSDDYADADSAGWEEEAATDLTEDAGGWDTPGGYGDDETVTDDDAVEENQYGEYEGDYSVVEESAAEENAEENAEDVEEDVVAETDAETHQDSTDEYAGDQAQPEEQETDLGTLADRMAREASRADVGEDRASGRRPWERGSV